MPGSLKPARGGAKELLAKVGRGVHQDPGRTAFHGDAVLSPREHVPAVAGLRAERAPAIPLWNPPARCGSQEANAQWPGGYSAATYAVTSMPVGTISATGGVHVRRGAVSGPDAGGAAWLASTAETPGGVASSGRRSVSVLLRSSVELGKG